MIPQLIGLICFCWLSFYVFIFLSSVVFLLNLFGLCLSLLPTLSLSLFFCLFSEKSICSFLLMALLSLRLSPFCSKQSAWEFVGLHCMYAAMNEKVVDIYRCLMLLSLSLSLSLFFLHCISPNFCSS